MSIRLPLVLAICYHVPMNPIDAYLSGLAAPEKAELERIRAIVAEAVPAAEQGMSYGMPAFKYRGKYLVGYYAFKSHLSLFPAAAPIEAFKGRLEGYAVSKGTIQFTLDHVLPEDLIREIVQWRAADIDNGWSPAKG